MKPTNVLPILIGCLILLKFDVAAQTTSLEDHIYTDVINFLRSQGNLEQRSSLSEYQKRIFFFEIQREELFNSKRNGIYTFGVSSSESKRYILIFNEGKWKIYDMKDMTLLLNDACAFFLGNHLSNQEVIKYTTGIINAYEYNDKY